MSGGRRSRASAPLPLSSSSGLRSAQMNRLELLANTWNAVGELYGSGVRRQPACICPTQRLDDGSAKTRSIRVTNF